MKLKQCESLGVARKVWSLVDVPAAVARQVDIQTYCNGREQGYAARCLLMNSKFPKPGGRLVAATICWAQQRSSDEIIVYIGQPDEFFDEGNVPTQRAYENALTFKRKQHLRAAMAISKAIIALAKQANVI